MLPKITIAMNSRNGIKYLEQSIPAWLNQNYPNFELVIVDDGSTDGTNKYLESFNQKVRYIKLESNTSGYGFGKNACVKNSQGEYILLLDNDILPQTNEYLLNIYNKYLKLDNPAFLGTGLYDLGSEETKYYGIYYSIYGINIHRKSISKQTLTSNDKDFKVGSFHGGGVFFKKSIWDELGGYDTLQPFMLDDTDLSARAYTKGYNVYLYHQELLEHVGINNHEDKQYFAWKFQYYFSGISTVLLKNIRARELYRLFLFFLIAPFIYISIALKKRNSYIILAFFKSIFILAKNLTKVFSRRNLIQKTRGQARDEYLYISSIF